MARRPGSDYAFVRSYASLGSDLDDIQKALAAGYGGVLLDYADPQLEQAVRDLQGAGISFGFWGDPFNQKAEDYVNRMAMLNQKYNPTVLVPDLEFRYKGYAGSPQWEESAALARLWQQKLGGVNTIVTPMGNQADFNYQAWLDAGAAFAPQAYGADSNREALSYDQTIQTLLAAGVPMDRIFPVLSPAHAQSREGSMLWTLDDYIGKDVLPYLARTSTGPTVGTKSRPGSAPGRPMLPKPRLSQSDAMIQKGGLKWYGNTYNSVGQFKEALSARGADYATWARNHPTAAAALLGRSGRQGGVA